MLHSQIWSNSLDKTTRFSQAFFSILGYLFCFQLGKNFTFETCQFFSGLFLNSSKAIWCIKNWHGHIRITKHLNEIQSMITAWKIQQGPWVTSQSEERKTWKLNYETRFLKNCKLSKTDVYEKEDFHFNCE